MHYNREYELNDVDPRAADQFVRRTVQYWRELGLEVEGTDKGGVASMTGNDGVFGFDLIVNRDDRTAFVAGSTPRRRSAAARHPTPTAMNRRRALAYFLLLAVASTGCANRKEATRMDAAQAKAHVRQVVDETFARGAPGRQPMPASSDGATTVCRDNYGRPLGPVHYNREYELNDVDPRAADQFVRRTVQYWRELGLEVEGTDKGGLASMTGNDGVFGFDLIVNREDRTAFVAGSTPCVERDDRPKSG